jgi:acyl transferase domain-containing protein/acyl carrier protein
MSGSDLDIAVIGMACRLPGADTVEAFWQNLRGGVESVSFFTPEELAQAGVRPEEFQDPAYIPAKAITRDVERFDARFFGYTSREAQVLDPQQRLFLEVAWEALERAGYDSERYRKAIGVFGGVSPSHWPLALWSNPELMAAVSGYQIMLSTDKDFLASRVAYKLDLRGPAVAVQTACSTSLVAVHMACQSLLAGECDTALAGGVSISVPQKTGYPYEADAIASRDGHCRAFDAEASGTVSGNGAGIVVLKRLADALRDGDQVEAVIKGSAANNDGARRVGFTAPGVDGQVRVIRAAQAAAGVGPDEIGYVEAHGTGTSLGDPVEVEALSRVFRARTERRGYCGLGSVKTNIGHLDAAAGIAGLLKAILMLKHGELVPSLHFERPNPRIDFEASPFFVATRTAPWPLAGTRRAGVSAFGIGGTNVHVVLEEAPGVAREAQPARPEIVRLSARTATALDAASDALVEHLDAHPEVALEDVAFTLRAGRRVFAERRAVVARDSAEAATLLAEGPPQRVFSGSAPATATLAFLFSGQGTQHVGMGEGLYRAEPAFRAEVDACCEVLAPRLGLDLRRLLYPEPSEAAAAGERLSETRFAQPALFAVEYALARLWASWGVVPEAMLGHSLGEYVAACLAGVFERDVALGLVAERARLMQECPRGAMTAVALSAEAVAPLLASGLDLCVVNGPDASVVGGSVAAVEAFEARLQEAGAIASRIATSHAFHSALMEPALAGYGEAVQRVSLQAPRLPYVSNLTGTWITPEEATDPGYWVRHLRETVRFDQGLQTLLARADGALLEIGPGHTLTALAKRRLGASGATAALASMRHPRQAEADDVFLLQAAARLWSLGAPVDWAPRDRGRGARRVTLPTYPFERERFWIDAAAARVKPAPGPGRLPLEQWLSTPSWKRGEELSAVAADGAFCVFAEDGALGESLVGRLRSAGASVTVVKPGSGYTWLDEETCVLTPGLRGDYERLVAELAQRDRSAGHWLHLWSAGEAPGLERGFLSVLRLGEALGRQVRTPTRLTVVSRGLHDVLGDEAGTPLEATLLGPCLVLPQEYPLLECRNVDLGTGPADGLLAEILASGGGPVVALRGRYRWLPGFEAVAAEAGGAPRLRSHGVYVVTGGLGRVAHALCLPLARDYRARLVLVGRTPLSEATAEQVAGVRALETLGSEVLTVAADVSQPAEVERVFALARERFGRIDGVVHAAGEVGDATFQPAAQVERADLERQLRAKLGGAQAIAGALREDAPDFVLLTSSLASVLGGLGFAAYAAANASLDAFARQQHRAGRRFWISTAWDGWHFPRPGQPERPGISAEEGGRVFERLLAGPLRPQLLISTSSLEARLAAWTNPGLAEAQDAAAGVAIQSQPRPELSAVYVAPEEAVERWLASLWGELLGIDKVGLDDNFFELGGSSLVAVHMMGRVRKQYPVDVSVATLFEGPSVRALAAIVRARQEGDDGLGRSAERGTLRKQGREIPRRTSDAVVE